MLKKLVSVLPFLLFLSSFYSHAKVYRYELTEWESVCDSRGVCTLPKQVGLPMKSSVDLKIPAKQGEVEFQKMNFPSSFFLQGKIEWITVFPNPGLKLPLYHQIQITLNDGQGFCATSPRERNEKVLPPLICATKDGDTKRGVNLRFISP